MKTVEVLALSTMVVSAMVGAAKFPSNFKICHQRNPKFKECLEDAIQDSLKKLKNGLPDLGLFPLDPLEITTLDLGQGKGPVSIGLRFDNAKIYGISDSTINNEKIKLEEYYLAADAFTPRLRMEADYIMDGKVLLLPISGKGKCTITLKNLKSHIEQKGEALEKNGLIYMNETQFLYKMDPEQMETHFENLFNGDAALGANMNKFLNENWRDVLKELKPALEEALGLVFNNIANRFFLKVPFNEVFPK